MKVSPYLMRPLRTLDQVLDDSSGDAAPAGSDVDGQAEGAGKGEGRSDRTRRLVKAGEGETSRTRSTAAE